MKYELKYEFNETKILLTFIKKAYKNGKLVDKNNKLTFKSDTEIYTLCKSLTNNCIRLHNNDIMEGSLKFIIQEEKNRIDLYPCCLFYEIINDKYIFDI